MKTKTPIEHLDFLGQPIRLGDYVSFTWSTHRGIRIGKILKLTKQRVRIVFNNFYIRDGVRHEYVSYHITRPTDCLILGEGLQPHLTMATLQKKI